MYSPSTADAVAAPPAPDGGTLIAFQDVTDSVYVERALRERNEALVTADEMKIKFVKTFSDVALGQPLLYVDSRGHMALAVNQNSFAATYRVKPPVELVIPRAK